MLYVVYNQETDIDEVRTENLLEAVQQATEIYDKTYDQHKNKHNDKNYTVQIIDMDEDIIQPTHENKSLVNKEVYHNLDEEEQLEVLKFVPDAMLIHELARRMSEYRKYADKIRVSGEELMIYV